MTEYNPLDFSSMDPNSYSNSNEIITTHTHINWTANFNDKCLTGYVLHSMVALRDVEHIVLDSNSLVIKHVSANNVDLKYEFAEYNQKYGSPLKIMLDKSLHQNQTINIRIDYSTTPSASAIQWLNPEQTVGKKKPYLFTQCQAIHARSLLPCMDTPAIKITYIYLIIDTLPK